MIAAMKRTKCRSCIPAWDRYAGNARGGGLPWKRFEADKENRIFLDPN
jgi:hypothetical protein